MPPEDAPSNSNTSHYGTHGAAVHDCRAADATALQLFTRLCGSNFTPDCLADDKRGAKRTARFRCAAAILEKGSFIEPNSKFDPTALSPGI